MIDKFVSMKIHVTIKYNFGSIATLKLVIIIRYVDTFDCLCYIFLIMDRKRSSGFRRIFTVDFLLFLAPAGGSNLKTIS